MVMMPEFLDPFVLDGLNILIITWWSRVCYRHYQFSFDPVSSPSTELDRFRMITDFLRSIK